MSSLDLVVFSHVAQIAVVDKEQACPLRDFLENDCKNLGEFVERVKEKIWVEDWAKATGEKMHMNPHMVVEEEKKEEEATEEVTEEKKEEETKGEATEEVTEEKK